MRQFISDSIDQLDLALDQLAIKDRNFDRFALMLIDNIVELTLHYFIQDKASENELYKRRPPKHDPGVIQEALRQSFDNKAKGARKLGLFDIEMCETILYMHTFRNTTYHEGLRHEGILHSISIFYFRCACKISILYEPRTWRSSSRDKISYRTRKYIGDENLDVFNHKETHISAYERLDKVAASMEYDLVVDLSNDMKSTIDDINNNISLLANDGDEKKSRNGVIIDTQAWSFAFTDKAQEYAKENNFNDPILLTYVEWLSHNYDWPIKSDPIPAWRRRWFSLRGETNVHKALKKYCDFMKQTEDIRSILNEAAAQRENSNRLQVDIAQGK